MQKLIWQNAKGEEINLTKDPFGITEWNGFSNADLNVQSQEVPFHDGSVYLDSLLSQRELSVTLAINDDKNLETRYRLRRELIAALNPKLGEGYLIYTNDFISKRIKCIPQMPVFPTHNSNDPGTPKASLAWTACDPYWEDLEENVVLLQNKIRTIVENKGDVPCAIKAQINSLNITNPELKSFTTQKKIKLNGTFTDNVSINTGFGEKSVFSEKSMFQQETGFRLLEPIYFSDKKIFIACDNEALCIYTSENGENWNPIALGMGYSSKKLFYIKECGMVILLSETNSDGFIHKTTNGTDWEKIELGELKLISISYSENLNLYVAIGADGIYKSTNLTNWDLCDNSQEASSMLSIVYSKNKQLFVACGSNGLIGKSTDGENWTFYTFEDITFYNITCSDDLFVVVGGDRSAEIKISNDGENWTSILNLSTINNPPLKKVIYVKNFNMFIAIPNGLIEKIYVSYNGYLWKIITVNDEHHGFFSGISYNEDKSFFIITCDNTYKYYKSFDCNNWLKMKLNQGDGNDIAYSKKRKIYVTTNGFYSYNGKDWMNNEEEIKPYNCNCIIYSEKHDLFLAVDNYSYCFRSNDGIHWEKTKLIVNNYSLNYVCYSEKEDLFVIVGNNGIILESKDAITWRSTTPPVQENFIIVCYYANAFYALYLSNYWKTKILKGYVVDGHIINWDELENIEYDFKCNGLLANENDGIIAVGSKENNTGTLYKGFDFNNLEKIIDTEMRLINIKKMDNGVVFVLAKMVGSESSTIICELINDELIQIYKSTKPLKTLTYSDKDNQIIFSGTNIIRLFYIDEKNIIDKLTSDSDMNFNLIIGNNELNISENSGFATVQVTYRQKYIGV